MQNFFILLEDLFVSITFAESGEFPIQQIAQSLLAERLPNTVMLRS